MKRILTVLTIVALGFAPGASFAATVKKPTPKTYEVPILVYHSIAPKTDKKESKMAKHYHIYPENFEAQMQYLKDGGYSPITLAALVDHYKNGTAIPEKAVVLAFDDGWKNQYTYAYPALKKFGYKATFFIISGYSGKGYDAYMKWPDILDLDKEGMEISSHTVDHKNLAHISLAEAKKELTDSKKSLEGKLGHAVSTFAYPEYGHSAATEQAAKDAGYLAARAGWMKGVNGASSLFALKSQEAVNNTNPFSSKAQ